jgi:4-hydroxy-4-methyl-2-oxoglutarate aldolase
VFGDDDGIVIAPAAQIEAALELAETIAAKERAMLAAMARGEVLHDQTNFAEHVAALDAGERSALGFTIDVDAS